MGLTRYSDAFIAALVYLFEFEGFISRDAADLGGFTYKGISRNIHPDWAGWAYVDTMQVRGLDEDQLEQLIELVRYFYYSEYWVPLRLEEVARINGKVAREVFECAVNLPWRKSCVFLQTALNVLNMRGEIYPDLEEDGFLGEKTQAALRSYFSGPGSEQDLEELLLNCTNGEQYIYYKNNPQVERQRGWFKRVRANLT